MSRLASDLLWHAGLALWFLFLAVATIVAFVAVGVAVLLVAEWAVYLTVGLHP